MRAARPDGADPAQAQWHARRWSHWHPPAPLRTWQSASFVAPLVLLLPLIQCACTPPNAAPPVKPVPQAANTAGPVALGGMPPAGDPTFVDVAAAAGLDAVIWCGGPSKNHLLESTGSGCALVDVDRDGRLDVFLVNAWALDENPTRVAQRGSNKLYRNLGNGRYADVSQAAGVASDRWGCGVCAADYDNDGHVDLYVTNFGPNSLLHNQGDGTFEEVGQAAGVADSGWSTGAAFFDADGDGWLDLYVANYVDCTFEEVLVAERSNTWRDKVKVMVGPFGMRGGRDHFYQNRGDGTFIDRTDEVGMTDTAESYGLGVLASDLDNDGDIDVYVANDSNVNFLYRNDGTGHFEEIGAWSGAGVSSEGKSQAGMGVDAADLDHDGLFDLLVTNFAKDYATLYQNDGKLFFTDVSQARGLKLLTYESVKWGCAFLDYNQDGDADICIANGHIYPQVDAETSLRETYRLPPTLLRSSAGRWSDVSRSAGPGFQLPVSARGLAVGDIDEDGDVDVLISAIDAPPLLLRNDSSPAGHWLKLRLTSRHGGPAVGARATITVGGQTQLGEVRSGSSYASQNSFDLHFGLGPNETIDRLQITWSDGRQTVETNLAADQLVTRRESAPIREAALIRQASANRAAGP